jgi:hypothetical protein
VEDAKFVKKAQIGDFVLFSDLRNKEIKGKIGKYLKSKKYVFDYQFLICDLVFNSHY